MHMDRADKNKVGTVEIEDLRVIPVIFLPGVMGSNLMDKKGKSIWRYDDSMSLMGWSLPTSGPKERKRLLHPDRVEVDNRGRIPAPPDAQEKLIQLGQQYPEDPSDKEAMDNYTQAVRDILDNIEPEAKLFGSRKDRGWGEVANASYGSFLDVLQTALYRDKPTKKGETLSATYQQLLDVPLGLEYGPDSLDEEYLEVIRLYQFPVHVVGYNWLGSNMLSAIRLQEQIKKIVGGYQKRGMKCHKVILVTHSMGGLVARYFSECLSGNTDVYGIVHGVLPSIGAAATYTRMKRGTENPESNPEGYVISHILGRNAAEMVAVFSQSPGPMELLPMNDYGEEWLNIVDRDGSTLTLPKNPPIKEGIAPEERTYAELYLNRENWWKLVDENLLNPFNTSLNQKQIDTDWNIYENLITESVNPFHKQIAGKYHINTYSFYGRAKLGDIPEAHLTQENVLWKGSLSMGKKSDISLEPKFIDGRLDLNEVGNIRTIKDEFSPEEQAWEINTDDGDTYVKIGQRFTLRDSCENGDGTVPLRAGQIVHKNILERLAVQVSHEAAYRNPVSQAFALRSIIKIAQEVKKDGKMSYSD
ncbi:hypothetical protein HMPREF1617_03151 [Escherichia coli 908675]|nr:hypothetical protein HMPREF1617_03151 [Escherichia coli 908675]